MSSDPKAPAQSGGEHQNGRRAMDKLTDGLIKSGMEPSRARETAREVAIRNDRGAGAKHDPRR